MKLIGAIDADLIALSKCGIIAEAFHSTDSSHSSFSSIFTSFPQDFHIFLNFHIFNLKRFNTLTSIYLYFFCTSLLLYIFTFIYFYFYIPFLLYIGIFDHFHTPHTFITNQRNLLATKYSHLFGKAIRRKCGRNFGHSMFSHRTEP